MKYIKIRGKYRLKLKQNEIAQLILLNAISHRLPLQS